jgi:hypothetical protein
MCHYRLLNLTHLRYGREDYCHLLFSSRSHLMPILGFLKTDISLIVTGLLVTKD